MGNMDLPIINYYDYFIGNEKKFIKSCSDCGVKKICEKNNSMEGICLFGAINSYSKKYNTHYPNLNITNNDYHNIITYADEETEGQLTITIINPLKLDFINKLYYNFYEQVVRFYKEPREKLYKSFFIPNRILGMRADTDFRENFLTAIRESDILYIYHFDNSAVDIELLSYREKFGYLTKIITLKDNLNNYSTIPFLRIFLDE